MKSVSRLRRTLGQALDAIALGRDLVACKLRRRRFAGASPRACRSVSQLHRLSAGRSTERLHRFLEGRRVSAARLPTAASGPEPSEQARALEALARDGIFVFGERLPIAVCRSLREWTEGVAADVYDVDGSPRGRATYRPADRAWPSYHLPTSDLLAQPEVQRLLALPGPRRVAAAHFGRAGILQRPEMWWNTDVGETPDAFQRFHFDTPCRVGRPLKWLRFFVYLNDVGPENGPHVYVRGSHRPWKAIRSTLGWEYEDAEAAALFGEGSLLEVVGEAGTAFLVDTVGLHKAERPRSGDRLVFEMQISGTDFVPRAETEVIERPHPELLAAAEAESESFRLFDLRP